MLRPKSSFSTAQLAIGLAVGLAIGLPLALLMFAGLRTRQLQSTANPRWAQFAKLSGAQSANENQKTSDPKRPVQMASLPTDEFSDSTSAPTRTIPGLTGSVVGHSSIEIPVRSTPTVAPSTRIEPAPQSATPPSRQLILFRPVDEDDEPAKVDTGLATQLRDVERRLDRLSQHQQELAKQRNEDTKRIEQPARPAQRTTKKAPKKETSKNKASLSALNEWLKDDEAGEPPKKLRPTEATKPTDDDAQVDRHQASQPGLEWKSAQTSPALTFSAPATSDKPSVGANQWTQTKTTFEAPVPQSTQTSPRPVTSLESTASTVPVTTHKSVSAPKTVDSTPPTSRNETIAKAEPAADRHEAVRVEAPLSKTPPPTEAIRIKPAGEGTDVFSMDVRDGDVREFFHQLSQAAHVSILVSPKVSGSITLSLHRVRLETALNAIARSHGYIIEREGEITQISTVAEASHLKQQQRALVMRVYQPSFLSAVELNRLIVPLLSNDGRHSSSALTERSGGERTRIEDHHDDDVAAQRDAVIVQDVAEVHDRIQQILVEMDVPPLQVEIEARILCVTLPDAGSTGLDLRQLPCVPSADDPNCTSTGELKQATLACSVPSFVNSVSRLGETQIVSTQRIQVLNKRRAEMLIGDRIGYQSCSDGTIQFLESGTRMIFRPSISADGWIKMEVQPGQHSVEWNKRTKAPRQQTAEISTQVLVPNGATLAIGGLITEQTIEKTHRVPVVGAIPVVGSHFRHRQDRIQRSELIILVTPHIVTDCGAGPTAPPTPDLMHIPSPKAEKGKQTLDRYELARAHYARATDYLQRGNTVKARQQVEASLRHNPHDADAHRLRTEIDQSLTQYVTR